MYKNPHGLRHVNNLEQIYKLKSVLQEMNSKPVSRQ